MTDSPGIVVVGGGIAGLAAALRLVERAAPGVATLVESTERLGGKILTERTDGFVIEGGPDSFLSSKPDAVELCRELSLEDRLRGTDPDRRRSFVRRDGRLFELPAGITGLVPSRIGPLLATRILSVRGRLRAGLEYFVPGRGDSQDETIRAFITRRFGAEAYDWLVEPLLSGIHAGDGGRLSLRATFPHIADMERAHGSLLRAMWRRRAPRPAGPGLVSIEGGLAEMVSQIERRIPPERIRRGTPAIAVRREEDRYRVELADGSQLTARAVILATPAFVSAELVRTLDPELARRLAEIPFVSTAIVTLAYPVEAVPHPLNGSGYLSPRAEGGPVVACSWTSSKFPGRAPEGSVLLRIFVGRAGSEEVVGRTAQELERAARVEVSETLGIRAEPTVARVHRWPRGMPQYVTGHLERIERIERRLAEHPGLFLAGASYRGVGIPDCIRSGWTAAAGALLAAGTAAWPGRDAHTERAGSGW
ncbi:MAG: protoporphyrinogen oxidase [Gemmatimonadota bacterium]